MKQKIQDILDTKNIKQVSYWVKKDKALYEYLCSRYQDDYTVGEMVVMCLNDMDSSICKNGKKKTLISISKGFKYCGRGKACQCFMDDVSEKTKIGCANRTEDAVQQSNDKRIATTRDKYGSDNVSQVDHIKTKRENTIEQKYGVRSMFSLQNVKEEGMITAHGVSNPSHSSSHNKKREATNLKKYGGHPAQQHFTPEVRALLNDKESFIEYMSTRSHRTIMSELGISQTGLLGYKLKHGIEVRSRSSYEEELKHIFLSWGINVKSNDHMVLRPFAPEPKNTKELDFYFPDHNLAVEFCGIHYHTEAMLNTRKEAESNKAFGKQYHLWKTERCEELGIKLITIFEDEYLDNKEIVLSRIRNALGLSEKGVYARKTNVCEIEKKVANQFLSDHHVQGSSHLSVVHFGAYDGDLLVGVMTFSKKRKSMGSNHIDDHYELIRFATDGRTHVGLASKLFRAFVRGYNPLEVISYADRRWSTGGVYTKMGFTHVHNSSPSYWYVKNNQIVRHHRSAFQKHKIVEKLGGDSNKTESENMIDLGYDRIWDCGTMKFVWQP